MSGGRAPIAALLAVSVVALAGVAGCTRPVTESSSGSQSGDAVASPTPAPAPAPQAAAVNGTLISTAIDGVPFALLTASDAGDPRVIRADSAELATEGHDYEVLGQTALEGTMPGPLPRVILDDGSAFGSLMHRIGDGEVLALEDIPSQIGLIASDGSFAPLEGTFGAMRSLSGSNPEDLYFEPQHASAFGQWVVWREGSAGRRGAMPTLDSDDWRLVAWNRDTGAVEEVASAFLAHGTRFAPYASWDVAPSTDGTDVYFEAMMPAAHGAKVDGDAGASAWVNSIVSAPLDGSGAVTVLDRGTMPVANAREGGAFWVSTDAVSATGKEAERGPGVVTDNGRPLFSVGGDGWRIVRLAGSSELLVATVSDGDGAWLVVYDLAADRVSDVIDTGSDWAEVSVSGREFIWGNGSGSGNPMMYRMDAEGRLRSLWGVQGLSAPLTNRSIAAVPIESDGGIVWRFLRWQS